jgi:hypothetical protein
MPDRTSSRALTKPQVFEILSNQKALDLTLTLRDVLEESQSLTGADEVAGYTVAWDKYVFIVEMPGENKGRPAFDVSKSVLRLNERVQDVLDAVKPASKLEEVAGYIFTEDKYTFIVGDVESEVVNPARRNPTR